MDLRNPCTEKISQMLEKGVRIPNPLTIDVGSDVDVGQISGEAVTIYPGCRIYGAGTVISRGAQLGAEGPVTLDDCQIGPDVELKGGYFRKAVFLEKAGMGYGAHVREGCILEEGAGGAHCVGLKQTILFPFVTLGSLINFCDCLMAGGTSRRDHSEVGSSYIHFNFTPDGDKATASLIGDVPRGVMLNQPAIFLGGQGGLVGPVSIGYGNIVSAGSIVRRDYRRECQLIVAKTVPGTVTQYVPRTYAGLGRVLAHNIRYLANLVALEQWYVHVRRQFFQQEEFSEPVYGGALDNLALARQERAKRLKSMAEKMPAPRSAPDGAGTAELRRSEFRDHVDEVCTLFDDCSGSEQSDRGRDDFLRDFSAHRQEHGGNYVDVVTSLESDVGLRGVSWLESVVDELCMRAAALLPSLKLFRH